MGGPKPTASRALVEYVQGELGCQRRRMRWDDPGICRSHGGWTSEPPAWTERGCCVAVRVADGMMAIVVSELRGMRASWTAAVSREQLEEEKAAGFPLAAAIQDDLRRSGL